MNSVNLIGRLTKDPDVRYANQLAVAKFTVAVNRDKENTDFIGVTSFGKVAENIEKYVFKGSLVAVTGRVQTSSYQDKNGNNVSKLEVIGNNVEFLSKPQEKQVEKKPATADEIPQYQELDEDIPF